MRVVRQAAAIALLGLVLLTFPPSARSDDTDVAGVIAGSSAIGLVSAAACLVAVKTAEDNGADEDAYARRGWLVGVGGSYAIETFEDDAASDLQSVLGPGTSFSVDNSFGINGRAGYRCRQRISAEVEVEWLDGFEADVTQAGLGKIATVDVEPLVITTNAKGYLLTGRYQPFLLVGAGVMTAKAKAQDSAGLGLSESDRETDFAMRFGGGVDIYATKNVVVSVGTDYVLPFRELKDLDYVSVGWELQYRF